jgi:hypothetical protein
LQLKIHSLISLSLLIVSHIFLQNCSIAVTITSDQWIERVLWMEMIVNMQGEDDFEAEYSIDQLVQLIQEGQEVVDSNIANDYMDENSIVIVDSNDIEPKDS